jgi:hypothetical protein
MSIDEFAQFVIETSKSLGMNPDATLLVTSIVFLVAVVLSTAGLAWLWHKRAMKLLKSETPKERLKRIRAKPQIIFNRAEIAKPTDKELMAAVLGIYDCYMTSEYRCTEDRITKRQMVEFVIRLIKEFYAYMTDHNIMGHIASILVEDDEENDAFTMLASRNIFVGVNPNSRELSEFTQPVRDSLKSLYFDYDETENSRFCFGDQYLLELVKADLRSLIRRRGLLLLLPADGVTPDLVKAAFSTDDKYALTQETAASLLRDVFQTFGNNDKFNWECLLTACRWAKSLWKLELRSVFEHDKLSIFGWIKHHANYTLIGDHILAMEYQLIAELPEAPKQWKQTATFTSVDAVNYMQDPKECDIEYALQVSGGDITLLSAANKVRFFDYLMRRNVEFIACFQTAEDIRGSLSNDEAKVQIYDLEEAYDEYPKKKATMIRALVECCRHADQLASLISPNGTLNVSSSTFELIKDAYPKTLAGVQAMIDYIHELENGTTAQDEWLKEKMKKLDDVYSLAKRGMQVDKSLVLSEEELASFKRVLEENLIMSEAELASFKQIHGENQSNS